MRMKGVVALGLVLLFATGLAGDNVRITAKRVARVFYPGERIELLVTADCPRRVCTYRVYSYQGRCVYHGVTTLGGNQTTKMDVPCVLNYGWYQVVLDMGRRTVEDAFCIIPRCWENTLGDDGLFHLQLSTDSERECAAAASVGIRCLRADVAWTNLERKRDQLDMSSLVDRVEVMQEYGLRLMGCLGYTPKWAGVQPANAVDEWTRVATFTYHPRDTIRWRRYVHQAVETTAGRTVKWPPDAVVPNNEEVPRQKTPFIHSWELWNEADLAFYTGNWGRYIDLLRITDNEIKDMQPMTPTIYGGSGNWFCMCFIGGNLAHVYFEQIACHPAGDIDESLNAWTRSGYQLPWLDGFPHKSTFNEGYYMCGEYGKGFAGHQQLPGDIFRIRVHLMGWDIDSYFRSSCVGQWVAKPGKSGAQNAMLLKKNGGLVPTPLYVAFAAARHWITDAAYVGPVDLGPEAESRLLLKDGIPMLVAWSDSQTGVAIDVTPQARRISPMGRAIHLSGPRTQSWTLGREPLMIWGVGGEYVREALHKRYRLYMDTEMGNDVDSPVWYGVSELKEDLANWTDEGYVAELDAAMADAAVGMTAHPSRAASEIRGVMQVCEEGMLQAAERSFSEGGFSERARTVMWRLADVNHWLGRIADNQSRRWSGFECTPAEIADLQSRISSAMDIIDTGEGQAAFSFKVLLRARDELDLARQLRRQGAFTASRSLVCLVEYLIEQEPRLLRRVFPLADFSTGIILHKAVLLEPGKNHEISVRIFNYLDRGIEGELEISVPATWEMTGPTQQPFVAEAGGISDEILYTFRIPGGPRPWPEKDPRLPVGQTLFRIPEGLDTRSIVRFRGALSTGTPLMDVGYLTFVGEMVQEPSAETDAAPSHGIQPLSRLRAHMPIVSRD